MAPLLVAASRLDSAAGWSPGELLWLTGCFMTIMGLWSALLSPALLASMNHIRRGTLDYSNSLLRPADALVSRLITEFAPWSLVETLGGLLLCVAALSQLGRAPGVVELLAAFGLGLAGLLALYVLGVLVLCASFRALQLQNLTFLWRRCWTSGAGQRRCFAGRCGWCSPTSCRWR